jgi:hypothetical protein
MNSCWGRASLQENHCHLETPVCSRSRPELAIRPPYRHTSAEIPPSGALSGMNRLTLEGPHQELLARIAAEMERMTKRSSMRGAGTESNRR